MCFLKEAEQGRKLLKSGDGIYPILKGEKSRSIARRFFARGYTVRV
jgi:hypothetical protein